MKKFSFLILTLLLFAACQKQSADVARDTQSTVPSDASETELNMAEMMGITVEELRNQTPEEHMRMMQELMEKQRGQK